MDNLTATLIAEGAQEAESEDQYLEAWQHLIDTGLAWQLQGSFGRAANALIRQGLCYDPSDFDAGGEDHLPSWSPWGGHGENNKGD